MKAVMLTLALAALAGVALAIVLVWGAVALMFGP